MNNKIYCWPFILTITGCGDTLPLINALTNAGQILTATDTLGLPGPSGVPGIHCWDLNGDGFDDDDEDINGDGEWNALDCQGSRGDKGPSGVDGQDGNVGQQGVLGEVGPRGEPGQDGTDAIDIGNDLDCTQAGENCGNGKLISIAQEG